VSLVFVANYTIILRSGLCRLHGCLALAMQVGRLFRQAKWDAMSNVEVSQMSYPVNKGRVGRERREGSERQRRREENREGGSGTGEAGQGSLAIGGRIYLDICAGSTEFLITTFLMGPVCLLSQGQFEEPVRP